MTTRYTTPTLEISFPFLPLELLKKVVNPEFPLAGECTTSSQLHAQILSKLCRRIGYSKSKLDLLSHTKANIIQFLCLTFCLRLDPIVTRVSQLTMSDRCSFTRITISLFNTPEDFLLDLEKILEETTFLQLPKLRLRLWMLCITSVKNTI
jgi:hypothetical protein